MKLDHINSHNHLHIHPTIAEIVVRLAEKYSAPVRLPYEPKGRWDGLPLPRWEGVGGRVNMLVMWPWVKLLKRKLEKNNIPHNDYVFGLCETGHMTEEKWLNFLDRIPEGIIEIYTHPATSTSPVLARTMPDYEHSAEFRALCSPRIKERLHKLGFQLTSFHSI